MARRFQMQPTRASQIPPGALKVALKGAPAEVYLYEDRRGRPSALGFAGKADKASFHCYYRDDARREAAVTQFFSGQLARVKFKAEMAAKDRAPRKLEVGHILRTSWGYDQTNVDYYEVTALVGSRMIEVRKIAATVTEETGWEQGKSVPVLGAYRGEPMRCMVMRGWSATIDGHHASLWDGTPQRWSSYA